MLHLPEIELEIQEQVQHSGFSSTDRLFPPPFTDAKVKELAAEKAGKMSDSERALTRNMDKKAWSGAPLLTSISGAPVCVQQLKPNSVCSAAHCAAPLLLTSISGAPLPWEHRSCPFHGLACCTRPADACCIKNATFISFPSFSCLLQCLHCTLFSGVHTESHALTVPSIIDLYSTARPHSLQMDTGIFNPSLKKKKGKKKESTVQPALDRIMGYTGSDMSEEEVRKDKRTSNSKWPRTLWKGFLTKHQLGPH